MLISPLNSFPWVINGLVEAWVSLKRVEKFICLKNSDTSQYYSSKGRLHLIKCCCKVLNIVFVKVDKLIILDGCTKQKLCALFYI